MHLKTSHILSVCVPLCAVLVVSVISWARWEDFRTTQQAIADSATRKVADDLVAAIAERERLTSLFADYESKLIFALLEEPKNDQLYDEIYSKASEHLPDFVAFTLATLDNNDIDVVSEDVEGRVGDICIDDMKSSLIDGHVTTRLHPNVGAYHYDAIVPLRSESGAQVLFLAAFSPNTLMQVLSSGQPYQHQLIIVNSQVENLIEFTSKGTRNNLTRDSFHLTSDESGRILSSAPVRDTQWRLLDLQSPGLFANTRQIVLAQAGILIATILLLTGFMLAAYRREECERVTAQQELLRSKRLLELTNAQLETSNAKLAETAVTDHLTGLWNRRKFVERLTNECHRVHRHQSPFSLIMVDVDHFKSINDNYGHPIGDQYLRAVADILREVASRRVDLVARYGGEEFVLLLPDTKLAGAAHIAEKIRAKVENFSLKIDEQGLEIRTTISLGVISSESFPFSIDPEKMTAEADIALYEAKRAGRNRVKEVVKTLAQRNYV